MRHVDYIEQLPLRQLPLDNYLAPLGQGQQHTMTTTTWNFYPLGQTKGQLPPSIGQLA